MNNILIIDDSSKNREWLTNLLESGGFTVALCASYAEGVQYLEDHAVDCVLLDWYFNAEEGRTILSRLRTNMLFLPVILMTVEENEALAAQAIKIGASNYLNKKELNAQKLAGVVQSTIDKVREERGTVVFKAEDRAVLLVEDNDDDRDNIEQMIIGLDGGYSVAAFATGTQTLAHFNKYGADCIILDYRLEIEDGLDILIKLKKISPFVPVIMLTGQGNEEIAAQSIKVGAADYLIKQRLNTTYLHTAIDNAISRAALEAKIADQQVEQRRFLATLVHDLRAPLRNVRQLGQLAVDEAQGGDLEELQKLLRSQSSVAHRATELIDTLETYALHLVLLYCRRGQCFPY